ATLRLDAAFPEPHWVRFALRALASFRHRSVRVAGFVRERGLSSFRRRGAVPLRPLGEKRLAADPTVTTPSGPGFVWGTRTNGRRRPPPRPSFSVAPLGSFRGAGIGFVSQARRRGHWFHFAGAEHGGWGRSGSHPPATGHRPPATARGGTGWGRSGRSV